jgi:lipoprotein NlpD
VGEPVRASGSGVVVHAGTKIPSFGNMIIIQHVGGYVTTYAHLSEVVVSVDDNVAGGQLIGFIGKTGNAEQPQLHFAIRHNTEPLDPVKKLQ